MLEHSALPRVYQHPSGSDEALKMPQSIFMVARSAARSGVVPGSIDRMSKLRGRSRAALHRDRYSQRSTVENRFPQHNVPANNRLQGSYLLSADP